MEGGYLLSIARLDFHVGQRRGALGVHRVNINPNVNFDALVSNRHVSLALGLALTLVVVLFEFTNLAPIVICVSGSAVFFSIFLAVEKRASKRSESAQEPRRMSLDDY